MAKLSLRIDEQDKETLERIADEQDLSVSQLVRRAIKEYLEQLNNKS